MESPSLSNPGQVTLEIHQEILSSLRAALAALHEKGVQNPGVASMRIREWSLIIDEGQLCLEIFLDKGYPNPVPAAPANRETVRSPIAAETRITLDECLEVHHWLLETPVLARFSDAVSVQVGSPGPEPALRDEQDFVASIGLMVAIQTWTKIENRDKFVMILDGVTRANESSVAVLKEGPHLFEVPLSSVKSAKAMPDHPATKPPKLLKKTKAKSGHGRSPAKKSKSKR